MSFQQVATKYAWYGHIGAVALATFYGTVGGANNWMNWLEKRNRVTIGSPMVDPVLNLGRDGGHLCYHLVASGGTSACIAAGFPVTIPALTFMSKEVGAPVRDNEDHDD